MKKILLSMMALCAVSLGLYAQESSTVDFEGDYYSALIDNPQYGGSLIYSGTDYSWTDAKTSLSATCQKADWSAWGMGYGWDRGIAISNYVDADETASYNKQLSVPESNGSKNFAVVWEACEMSFADGIAREIKSMQVSPTTYCLNNVKKSAGEGYEFKVTVTGTKADGTTSSLDIVLANGTDVKTGWFTVDLSSLGEVKSVAFAFDGTDKGDWGLQTPKYFAFDDVEVVGEIIADDEKTVDFEGATFAGLIDDPQYNGKLIYSADSYKWTDATTSLSGEVAKADWSAWGMGYGWANGFAISNYVDNSDAASYDKQLSVPESNGSTQFAVCYDDGSSISFADGIARKIKSMQVSQTTYCLNNVKKAAGEGYEFKVIATGTKADGTTSSVDIVLANGSDVKTGWFTVDMSALGEVKSVSFTFDGTDKSDWGLSTPKYLAIDNVKVIGEISTGIIEIATSAPAEVREVARYTLDGKKIATAQKGINIIRMSDGSTRKVLVK